MHDHYADHAPYQPGAKAPHQYSANSPPDGSWDGQPTPHSKWDPRGWSLKKKLFLAAGIIVVIVAVVVGSVLGVRANRYPNYSQLDYTLKDTFSGTDFFDNFEYFTDADPANGFVQYDPQRDSLTAAN